MELIQHHTMVLLIWLLNKKGFGYEKFPRKEIIRERIKEGTLQDTPFVLIPHLELAIRILSRYCSTIEYNRLHKEGFFKFSMKEKTELKILKDTLDRLELHLPFLEEYLNQWEKKRLEKKNTKKIELLTKFLEEK